MLVVPSPHARWTSWVSGQYGCVFSRGHKTRVILLVSLENRKTGSLRLDTPGAQLRIVSMRTVASAQEMVKDLVFVLDAWPQQRGDGQATLGVPF